MSVKVPAGFSLFNILVRLRGPLCEHGTEDTGSECKDGFLDLLLTNQFLKNSTSWQSEWVSERMSVWVWVGG